MILTLLAFLTVTNSQLSKVKTHVPMKRQLIPRQLHKHHHCISTPFPKTITNSPSPITNLYVSNENHFISVQSPANNFDQIVRS